MRRSMPFILATILLILLTWATVYNNYQKPHAVFWDENYHIASAEKYIAGSLFMEPHPPLGKMLIALGEQIRSPNREVDKLSFLETDYIREFPPGFSFKGYRFFPVVFASLNVLLFFAVLLTLSRNVYISFLFTAWFLFDNAIIVHSRGAMLEPFLIFFALLSLLIFFRMADRKISLASYAALSVPVGLALSVKINAAFLLLLFPSLFLMEHFAQKKDMLFSRQLARLVVRAASSIAVIAILVLSIFYIHIGMGKHLTNGAYKATPGHLNRISMNQTFSIPAFAEGLRGNIRYMAEYQSGVPRLDVCKNGENGSHPMRWILGEKSINYRWHKEEDQARYLYLVPNMAVWLTGLAGLALGISLAAGVLLLGLRCPEGRHNDCRNIFILLSLYMAYMAIALYASRVLYLYHYFLPLIVTLLISFVFLQYFARDRFLKESAWLNLHLFQIQENETENKSKLPLFTGILAIAAVAVMALYAFLSPLTYYRFLKKEEIQRRDLFVPGVIEDVIGKK